MNCCEGVLSNCKPLAALPRGGAADEEFSMPQVAIWPEDGWRRFDWAIPPGTCPSYEKMLFVNDRLPGLAKLCLSRTGQPHIRLELPPSIGDGADQIELCLASVEGAARVIMLEPGFPAKALAVAELPQACAEADLKISEICDEGGWACHERGENRWAVELEGNCHCLADVRLLEQSLELGLDLGDCGELPEASARAIAHLLLRAGGTIRMLRTSLSEVDGKKRARLLARIPFANARALNDALVGLSFGARWLLREIAALRSDEFAEAYLAKLSHFE